MRFPTGCTSASAPPPSRLSLSPLRRLRVARCGSAGTLPPKISRRSARQRKPTQRTHRGCNLRLLRLRQALFGNEMEPLLAHGARVGRLRSATVAAGAAWKRREAMREEGASATRQPVSAPRTTFGCTQSKTHACNCPAPRARSLRPGKCRNLGCLRLQQRQDEGGQWATSVRQLQRQKLRGYCTCGITGCRGHCSLRHGGQ